MHDSSMRLMGSFLERYLPAGRVNVLDVGSYSVCGAYSSLMHADWTYTGLDIAAGPNVDLVVSDPYSWREIPDDSFDVVISGQALEHIEFPWLTVQEIDRVLRPSGLVCLIAPSTGKEHRYPLDCYRYYPDGLMALAKWVGWDVLECFAERDPVKYPSMNRQWQDCVLIARKS